jgi:hypothetical protein
MRFILTAVVWLVILGGLWSYTRQRAAAEAVVRYENPGVHEVAETYTLRLTPTFSLEPDPFALKTEDSPDTAIVLLLNGAAIPLEGHTLQRGETWTVEKVAGLVEGSNEIHVQASPPLSESELEHGIRIRLMKSGVAAVDTTVWSQQGSLVSGSIHFELQSTGEAHDH